MFPTYLPYGLLICSFWNQLEKKLSQAEGLPSEKMQAPNLLLWTLVDLAFFVSTNTDEGHLLPGKRGSNNGGLPPQIITGTSDFTATESEERGFCVMSPHRKHLVALGNGRLGFATSALPAGTAGGVACQTAALNRFVRGLTSDSLSLGASSSTSSLLAFCGATGFFDSARPVAAVDRALSIFSGSYQYFPYHLCPGDLSHLPEY
ncbi:unnamed protein product [Phytophthora fragariaefolia]|uniref:Unnamed protein product n=1 Tax=Phytophthora fragariaefolia TaxID=1490495 RepID=A0A9W6YG59_9STRA|nr:unnamed protein product [Phytophthora fragariaefolia]